MNEGTEAPVLPSGEVESLSSSPPHRSDDSTRPTRVCFVSHQIYPLIANTEVPYIGGAELQQSIIAKSLRDNGYDVSLATIVCENRRQDEVIDGMRILKTFAPEDGVPGLRFFTPRLSGLWRALRRADADVYYQRCADKATGIVARFCRRFGRKFVYAGAHDNDFQRDVDLKPHERFMYRWGLRRADAVLVQSIQQQTLLKQNYGIDGHVLANVYPPRPLTTDDGYVLWVGNMRQFKRPLMCLEIARRFPDIRFVMIGGVGSGSASLYDQVKSQKPDNVQFLGFQPLETTERYFDGASLLLSTSAIEGFPNTFLQAWSRGIPTVSSFDPDHRIAENRLGKVFSSADQVDDCLEPLLRSSVQRRERVQQYFESRFTPQQYVDRLTAIVEAGPVRHDEPTDCQRDRCRRDRA